MSENISVDIAYGPLMPPIGVQLARQGLRSRENVSWFEDDRTAIQRLYLRDLLTTAMKTSALSKLHRRLLKTLEAAPSNPLPADSGTESQAAVSHSTEPQEDR
jgi:hypothetical protein